MRINQPLFHPEDGGGSGGSMITPGEAEPENKPEGSVNPPDEQNDPFGDLKSYRDEESGLYLGKYKTLPDVFEGYKNLSRKIQEKFPESPEQYESIRFGDEDGEVLKGKEIPVDDPMLKDYLPGFKALKLSQEQVRGVVKLFLENEGRQQPKPEVEKGKLGADAEGILTEVNSFVDKHFSPEEQQFFAQLGQTADGVKLVHKLSKMYGERPIPGKTGGASGKTKEEMLDAAFRYRKENPDIDNNPTKQKIYDRMLKEAHGFTV